jgi:hypothetical protein
VPTGLRSIGRFAAFAGALAALVSASACSTPHTASGTLDTGKQRVTALVLGTAHALPATATFTPPTLVGTQPCRRSLAGFGAGATGAHRAEVPLFVFPLANQPAAPLLAKIETAWEKAGYRIDRSRLDVQRFPQLRATTPDGFTVSATAFAQLPGRPAVKPQIDLYAVSPCLRGS